MFCFCLVFIWVSVVTYYGQYLISFFEMENFFDKKSFTLFFSSFTKKNNTVYHISLARFYHIGIFMPTELNSKTRFFRKISFEDYFLLQ